MTISRKLKLGKIWKKTNLEKNILYQIGSIRTTRYGTSTKLILVPYRMVLIDTILRYTSTLLGTVLVQNQYYYRT